MLQARPRKLTVEEFIDAYAGVDEKYELIDGVPWMMAGATPLHNLIAGSIFATLFQKLRGSGCLPFNSDTRLRLDDGNVRFPDVAIYCRPELDDLSVQTFGNPRAVFEVLSPSTARDDRVHKLIEYKRIVGLRTIVLVDPELSLIDVYERVGPAEWRNFTLENGADLVLIDPAITLTWPEIFATT